MLAVASAASSIAFTSTPRCSAQLPVLEQRDGLAISDPIERHRKLELIGGNTEIRACHRDALGITRELELRRRRLQRREVNVPVRQDEDPSACDTAVDAAGHLQNFV